MDVNKHLVLEIAQDIWASMLRMDLQERVTHHEELISGKQCLTGSVRILGKPEFDVVVTVPKALAEQATAVMLEVGLDEVSEALASDAVGELTNLVAGSIQNRISGRSRLSAPIVIQGEHGVRHPRPGSVKLLDLPLTSQPSTRDEQPAMIEVHQSLGP